MKKQQVEVAVEPIEPAGAEMVWRGELQRGERTTTTFDELWRAACLEARARDEIAEGLVGAANSDRNEAASILLVYLVKRAA